MDYSGDFGSSSCKAESDEEMSKQSYLAYLNLKRSDEPADLLVKSQTEIVTVRKTRRVLYRYVLDSSADGTNENEKQGEISITDVKTKESPPKFLKRKKLLQNIFLDSSVKAEQNPNISTANKSKKTVKKRKLYNGGEFYSNPELVQKLNEIKNKKQIVKRPMKDPPRITHKRKKMATTEFESINKNVGMEKNNPKVITEKNPQNYCHPEFKSGEYSNGIQFLSKMESLDEYSTQYDVKLKKYITVPRNWNNTEKSETTRRVRVLLPVRKVETKVEQNPIKEVPCDTQCIEKVEETKDALTMEEKLQEIFVHSIPEAYVTGMGNFASVPDIEMEVEIESFSETVPTAENTSVLIEDSVSSIDFDQWRRDSLKNPKQSTVCNIDESLINQHQLRTKKENDSDELTSTNETLKLGENNVEYINDDQDTTKAIIDDQIMGENDSRSTTLESNHDTVISSSTIVENTSVPISDEVKIAEVTPEIISLSLETCNNELLIKENAKDSLESNSDESKIIIDTLGTEDNAQEPNSDTVRIGADTIVIKQIPFGPNDDAGQNNLRISQYSLEFIDEHTTNDCINTITNIQEPDSDKLQVEEDTIDIPPLLLEPYSEQSQIEVETIDMPPLLVQPDSDKPQMKGDTVDVPILVHPDSDKPQMKGDTIDMPPIILKPDSDGPQVKEDSIDIAPLSLVPDGDVQLMEQNYSSISQHSSELKDNEHTIMGNDVRTEKNTPECSYSQTQGNTMEKTSILQKSNKDILVILQNDIIQHSFDSNQDNSITDTTENTEKNYSQKQQAERDISEIVTPSVDDMVTTTLSVESSDDEVIIIENTLEHNVDGAKIARDTEEIIASPLEINDDQVTRRDNLDETKHSLHTSRIRETTLDPTIDKLQLAVDESKLMKDTSDVAEKILKHNSHEEQLEENTMEVELANYNQLRQQNDLIDFDHSPDDTAIKEDILRLNTVESYRKNDEVQTEVDGMEISAVSLDDDGVIKPKDSITLDSLKSNEEDSTIMVGEPKKVPISDNTMEVPPLDSESNSYKKPLRKHTHSTPKSSKVRIRRNVPKFRKEFGVFHDRTQKIIDASILRKSSAKMNFPKRKRIGLISRKKLSPPLRPNDDHHKDTLKSPKKILKAPLSNIEEHLQVDTNRKNEDIPELSPQIEKNHQIVKEIPGIITNTSKEFEDSLKCRSSEETDTMKKDKQSSATRRGDSETTIQIQSGKDSSSENSSDLEDYEHNLQSEADKLKIIRETTPYHSPAADIIEPEIIVLSDDEQSDSEEKQMTKEAAVIRKISLGPHNAQWQITKKPVDRCRKKYNANTLNITDQSCTISGRWQVSNETLEISTHSLGVDYDDQQVTRNVLELSEASEQDDMDENDSNISENSAETDSDENSFNLIICEGDASEITAYSLESDEEQESYSDSLGLSLEPSDSEDQIEIDILETGKELQKTEQESQETKEESQEAEKESQKTKKKSQEIQQESQETTKTKEIMETTSTIDEEEVTSYFNQLLNMSSPPQTDDATEDNFSLEHDVEVEVEINEETESLSTLDESLKLSINDTETSNDTSYMTESSSDQENSSVESKSDSETPRSTNKSKDATSKKQVTSYPRRRNIIGIGNREYREVESGEPCRIEVVHYKSDVRVERKYCTYCKLGVTSEIVLEKHMVKCKLNPQNAKVEPCEIFTCKFCSVGVTDTAFLKQHEEKCLKNFGNKDDSSPSPVKEATVSRTKRKHSTVAKDEEPTIQTKNSIIEIQEPASKRKRKRPTIGKHKCPNCEYTTNNVTHMTIHKRTHDKIPLCVCDICQKGFNRLDSLRIHMFKHIDVATKVSEVKRIEVLDGRATKITLEVNIKDKDFTIVKYQCSKCIYTTPVTSSIENHFQSVHLNLKNFKCHLCSFATKEKANLSKHLNWHSREKTYKCSYCPYETITQGYIKHHENQVHLKAVSYKCEHCDYVAFHKVNLKSHMNYKHLKTKIFHCKQCDFFSYVQSNLAGHIKAVHEGIKRKYKRK